MNKTNFYASIAVIDLHPNHTISIESISVTKGKCLLSGAWDFPLMEAKKISDVVSSKLVIPLGDYSAFTNYFSGIQFEIVEASSFLHDAVLKQCFSFCLILFVAFLRIF